jgi:hypothetical protein
VLVDVAPHGSSVAQPSSITLYLGYGVAAAVAALAIGWAFQGRGRRLGLEGTNP